METVSYRMPEFQVFNIPGVDPSVEIDIYSHIHSHGGNRFVRLVKSKLQEELDDYTKDLLNNGRGSIKIVLPAWNEEVFNRVVRTYEWNVTFFAKRLINIIDGVAHYRHTRSRLVIDREPELANEITVILQRTYSVYYKKPILRLITAFPSSSCYKSTPEPSRITSLIKNGGQRKGSKRDNFWSQHALAYGLDEPGLLFKEDDLVIPEDQAKQIMEILKKSGKFLS